MDANEMTVTELKAMAYDTLAIIEHHQMEMKKINQLIMSKVNDEHAKAAADIGDSEEETEV